MRNGKDFIDRVVKKMAYTPSEFVVVEGNVYEEVKEDVDNALNDGMVFLMDTCIPKNAANQIAKEYNDNEYYKVITCDVDNGVSIIMACADGEEIVEGINIQPLGVINAFLNQLGMVTVEPKEEGEPTEHISLKDYYRLNLPDNKIGRKSDKTLTKELVEAGFSVK